MNLCASEGIMNSRPVTEIVNITQMLLHYHKVNTSSEERFTLTSLQEHYQDLDLSSHLLQLTPPSTKCLKVYE